MGNVNMNTLHKCDLDCCAPTVLLDLCLEALIISEEKYQEAYTLCKKLLAQNDWPNDKFFGEDQLIEMFFSRAFDFYIRTQNQEKKIPITFSAFQRFREKYPG